VQKPDKSKSQSRKDAHQEKEAAAAAEAIRNATRAEIARWRQAAGTALGSLRRDRDQKQWQTAEMTGLPRQDIANLEARGIPKDYGKLMVIIRKLGITPVKFAELTTYYYQSSAPARLPDETGNGTPSSNRRLRRPKNR